jgi:putative GTP pyrophosphokinase
LTKKDYIQNPRSEDGYRSLHLIYRYKNKQATSYDRLRLEVQIRTKLQHMWATAVETMGTFLGQALKSRQRDKAWLDFFAMVSSAFALKEKCPPVPRFSHLTQSESVLAVAKAEAELQALEKMRGFSIAADSIVKSKSSGKGWSYHLIILDSLKHTVRITPYERDGIERAVADYSEIEAEAARGQLIEPVLVSVAQLTICAGHTPISFSTSGISFQVWMNYLPPLQKENDALPNNRLHLTGNNDSLKFEPACPGT